MCAIMLLIHGNGGKYPCTPVATHGYTHTFRPSLPPRKVRRVDLPQDYSTFPYNFQGESPFHNHLSTRLDSVCRLPATPIVATNEMATARLTDETVQAGLPCHDTTCSVYLLCHCAILGRLRIRCLPWHGVSSVPKSPSSVLTSSPHAMVLFFASSTSVACLPIGAAC